MPGLKLTMATSIYGNPYKWVRTLATTTTSYNPLSSSSPSSFYALNNTTTTNPNTQKISVSWRITHCAPLAHVRINPRKNLGFRSHKSFSSSSSSSSYTPKSCSEDSGGERDSSSSSTLLSGGVVGEKMGSEDNHYNRQLPSLPSQQQQQQQSQLQQQLQHPQSSKLLTLPTILTLGRVAAVPLLVSTFYLNSWWGTTATTSIFIAAAITDWLDGYIARKMRLGTAFGAFLDPVADKLMVAATLILLCSRPFNVDMFGEVPWLLTVPAIAIIGREITMSAVREWAASQNAKLLEAVAVNNLGKWKTASQMTALTILLATRDSSLAGPGVLVASGVGLLYISAGLAVWSLVVYMMKIWKVLLK